MSFQTRSKAYEQGNAIKKTIYYGHYYITRNKYNELSAFSVKGGDIIISCAGTIGEIYKLPESCENGVINQALMRVRTYKNIDENFFEYYFTGVLKNNVIDQANGTAIRACLETHLSIMKRFNSMLAMAI